MHGTIQQALISWKSKPKADQIWEHLKIHFIEAYTICLTSGAGMIWDSLHLKRMTSPSKHSSQSSPQASVQVVNTASHQTKNDNINALHLELAQMQQQLANYT